MCKTIDLNFLNKLPFESAVIALAIIKCEYNNDLIELAEYAIQIKNQNYNFVHAYGGINLSCDKNVLHDWMIKELEDDLATI